MKKLSLYSMLLASVFAASCNGDYDDWADPQSNEQQAAITLPGFTAATVAAIDLGKVTDDSVQIATVTAPTLAEGTLGNVRVNLAGKKTLNASNDYKVAKAELQQVLVDLYGRRPLAREMEAYLDIDVKLDGQSSLLTSEKYTLTVTPEAPVIEESYYLIGALNNWTFANVTDDYKFKHSSKDVYEDPVFTFAVNVTDKEKLEFKVAPLSSKTEGSWTNVLGTDDEAKSLLLGDGLTNLKFPGVGSYLITLNMMDYTYTIVEGSPYAWVPGAHQSEWNPATGNVLYGEDMANYSGSLYLNGGFKICPVQSWVGACGFDAFKDKSANITASSDGNLVVDPGFYYLKANMVAGSIEATLCTVSVIGSVKGNWDTDVEMTYDKATNCWQATADLTAGEFKFRANKAWTISWGGSAQAIVYNGGNMKLDEAGNYTIKLYLTNDESSRCTVTKN